MHMKIKPSAPLHKILSPRLQFTNPVQNVKRHLLQQVGVWGACTHADMHAISVLYTRRFHCMQCMHSHTNKHSVRSHDSKTYLLNVVCSQLVVVPTTDKHLHGEREREREINKLKHKTLHTSNYRKLRVVVFSILHNTSVTHTKVYSHSPGLRKCYKYYYSLMIFLLANPTKLLKRQLDAGFHQKQNNT